MKDGEHSEAEFAAERGVRWMARTDRLRRDEVDLGVWKEEQARGGGGSAARGRTEKKLARQHPSTRTRGAPGS